MFLIGEVFESEPKCTLFFFLLDTGDLDFQVFPTFFSARALAPEPQLSHGGFSRTRSIRFFLFKRAFPGWRRNLAGIDSVVLLYCFLVRRAPLDGAFSVIASWGSVLCDATG